VANWECVWLLISKLKVVISDRIAACSAYSGGRERVFFNRR